MKHIIACNYLTHIKKQLFAFSKKNYVLLYTLIMHIICILVVLCLNVSYGHESCDRKEMEDTICSLCSQRKESLSGTNLQVLEFFVFIYNFILKDMN